LEKKNTSDNKTKKRFNKVLKIVARILLVLLIIFILLVLFVRSPWGQDIIVGKLTNYVSNKTNTEVKIDKLFITFDGDISLEGLYLEDEKGDTLIYSRSLEADIPIWPLIKGNSFSVDNLEWKGARANIIRKDSVNGFNFQFLMDAFATTDTTQTQTTASKPMDIFIGNLDFSEIRLTYKDSVSGIDTELDLGRLSYEGEKFDLQQMDFEAGLLSLENTSVNVVQTKNVTSTDTTTTALPKFRINEVSIKNVKTQFKSIPQELSADVYLEEFTAENPFLDLQKQIVDISELQLNRSNINFQLPKQEATATSSKGSESFSIAEVWPDWEVNLTRLQLKENNIAFRQGDAAEISKGFNPENFNIENFNFNAEDIQFSKAQTAQITVNQLDFKETISNLSLNELSFETRLEKENFQLENLKFASGNTQLAGNFSASYTSLDQLVSNPEQVSLQTNLNSIRLDMNDLLQLNPELKNNEYIRKLAAKPVTGYIIANGKIENLNITKVNLNWGSTKIATSGQIKSLTDPEKLQLNLKKINVVSTRKDVLQFVNEKDLGISVSETIKLTGNVKGGLNNLFADAVLTIPEGRVELMGSYKNQEQLAFDAKLKTVELDLGKILQNESLGKISAEIDTKGSGSNMNTLDAELNSSFSKLTYNEYDLSDLKLSGKITNGNGKVNAAFKDSNVNLNLEADVALDSVAPEVDFNLDLKGIDLYALGFTQKDIRAQLLLTGTYKGGADKFTVDGKLEKAIAVYDNDPYYIGDLNFHTQIAQDSTAVSIEGGFINAKLNSNTSPTNFMTALERHASHYFKEPKPRDSSQKPVKLKFTAHIADRPIISEVFVDGIQEMDSINLTMDFDEDKENLSADFSLPYVNYQENKLDSLYFSLKSDRENADFDLGFRGIEAGPLAIEKTSFKGNLRKDTLQLDFNAVKGEKSLYQVTSYITGNEDRIQFSINPENLILNKNPWETPSGNSVIFEDKTIVFNNFSFSRNNQELSFNNNFGIEDEHFGAELKNFKLSTLLGYFNPDEYLASGLVQGNFILVNPYEDLGMVADLKIEKFKVIEADLGELNLDASSKSAGNYDFDLGLVGEQIDLSITGDYLAQETGAELDLNLDMQKLGMALLQQFVPEELEKSEGSLNAQVKINGTLANPEYSGDLGFNNTSFVVKKLNSRFSISDEKINLDNKGVYFPNFSILDKNKNKFVVTGDILTEESLMNPGFDLRIKADNFQALNSTDEDNDLYYGTAIFDVNATLGGKLDFPILDVQLTVDKNTNVTYVVPPSQVGITEKDGVVIFVNKANPDAILTRKDENDSAAILTGIELTSKLNVEEGATVNVILDERTGDNLKLVGNGELLFNIERSGRTNRTGRYEVNDGHYEMNLYNLVKRKFNIAEGSTVTWGGDPMNADLDVRAIYKVETSASGLMASQTSGASATEQNRYRQKLPFLVYLNVDGELMQPKLNFGLDMPEDEQGAIGGAVYGRISQLNQQEDQLNKQVFSLLVLNRFYPESGSSGSNGGAATVARDNLNQALSDQLNVFSDKLTGNTGIELSFGLDSYTDYQGNSAQNRTDLNVSARKKLFNDRLVVQAGSEIGVQGENRPGEANPVIGNVSIEYLLTEDGRWRLRGFRKSEYENIIDGQVFVNGLALIFMREFNEFRELFKKPAKEIAQQEEMKQKENEQNKEEEKEDENTDASSPNAIKEEE
jgi:hypothetical protein